MELADQGTVFLDEIGEMSPYLQAKLLRFFNDGSFRRVGGDREVKVNVRILSATHRNLEKMVSEGTFAKTCSIASTCSTCKCRRCASAARTSCCWPATSCSRPARRSSGRSAAWRPAPIPRCWATAGRATCGSCRT
jgi:hypothetical protein